MYIATSKLQQLIISTMDSVVTRISAPPLVDDAVQQAVDVKGSNSFESERLEEQTDNRSSLENESDNRPIVLVTNDDGINAPGIRVLVELLVETGRYNVNVCAPNSVLAYAIPHIPRFLHFKTVLATRSLADGNQMVKLSLYEIANEGLPQSKAFDSGEVILGAGSVHGQLFASKVEGNDGLAYEKWVSVDTDGVLGKGQSTKVCQGYLYEDVSRRNQAYSCTS
eukprot:Gb_09387 [translate_table: standard]